MNSWSGKKILIIFVHKDKIKNCLIVLFLLIWKYLYDKITLLIIGGKCVEK